MVDMVEIIMTYIVMASEKVIVVKNSTRHWKNLVRFTNEANKKTAKKTYK